MKVNFMTFNIRHDPGGEVGKFDALPSSFLGEQPWSLRKYKVADTVLMWSPDIVGFQEPEYHQVIDLERLLNDEYEWVGAGRDDGKEKGEYCPVFYKRDMLRVENWRNLWLSETPDEPGSRSWDASAPRIATVVEFTRLEDNIKFTVLNAHFDHQGIESRRGAANVILEHIKNIQHMCVLMGDLNSPEDDPGYVTLTGKKGDNGNTTWLQLEQLHKKCSSAAFSQRQTGRSMRTTENNITLPTHRVVRPGQVLQNLQRQQQQQQQQQQSPTSGNVFLDTRYLLETRVTNDDARTPLSGPYGDQDTFTSFGHNDPDAVKAPRRLDYIMVAKHDSTRLVVRRFGVLSNLYDDGFYISDHRPVVAVLDW